MAIQSTTGRLATINECSAPAVQSAFAPRNGAPAEIAHEDDALDLGNDVGPVRGDHVRRSLVL
jgi:hypothetical protein